MHLHWPQMRMRGRAVCLYLFNHMPSFGRRVATARCLPAHGKRLPPHTARRRRRRVSATCVRRRRRCRQRRRLRRGRRRRRRRRMSVTCIHCHRRVSVTCIRPRRRSRPRRRGEMSVVCHLYPPRLPQPPPVSVTVSAVAAAATFAARLRRVSVTCIHCHRRVWRRHCHLPATCSAQPKPGAGRRRTERGR